MKTLDLIERNEKNPSFDPDVVPVEIDAVSVDGVRVPFIGNDPYIITFLKNKCYIAITGGCIGIYDDSDNCVSLVDISDSLEAGKTQEFEGMVPICDYCGGKAIRTTNAPSDPTMCCDCMELGR
jgi:hypothetical protein